MKGAKKSEKTVNLHLKIRLSELVHPSNHGRKQSSGISLKGGGTSSSDDGGRGRSRSVGKLSRGRKNKLIPSPYFELYAAHRCGVSRTYYKSHPLYESAEGIWEDAFFDLGLTHEQVRNGTNGAGHIEIGIRVMHCPPKVSESKLIGNCQVSLETLERQQKEMMWSKEAARRVGSSGRSNSRELAMSLQEPEKHPVLKGFEVTGRLQVLSFSFS